MTMLAGWAKYIKISVDADVIDVALSDFPVPVYISAASGIGDVDASCVFDELGSDANRKKIAVTTSDGTTQCYVEIERWDHASEKAWLHVKLPSVSESADTDFYLYYDSLHADNTTYVGDTTDAAAQSVWDSNFVGVYHMEQDPNGDAANCVKDSTSNANHMTPEGSMTSADLVDGQFGKAIDFDGSNDLLKCADNSTMDFTGGLTAEFLCKGPSSDRSLGGQWDTSGSDGNKRSFHSHFSAANAKFKIILSRTGYDATAVTITGATDLSSGSWYHLTSWCDLTNLKLFVNGAQDATAAQSAIYNSTDYLTISGLKGVYGTSGGWRSGPIADVRYSKTARSAAWLKATYNGLFDSLLTFGSEEITSKTVPMSAATTLRLLPKQVAGFQWDISGTVQEGGSPVARTVRLYKRSDGALIAQTTSDAGDGAYNFANCPAEPCYVVALDDEAGEVFNALILDRVKPGQDFS